MQFCSDFYKKKSIEKKIISIFLDSQYYVSWKLNFVDEFVDW